MSDYSKGDKDKIVDASGNHVGYVRPDLRGKIRNDAPLDSSGRPLKSGDLHDPSAANSSSTQMGGAGGYISSAANEITFATFAKSLGMMVLILVGIFIAFTAYGLIRVSLDNHDAQQAIQEAREATFQSPIYDSVRQEMGGADSTKLKLAYMQTLASRLRIGEAGDYQLYALQQTEHALAYDGLRDGNIADAATAATIFCRHYRAYRDEMYYDANEPTICSFSRPNDASERLRRFTELTSDPRNVQTIVALAHLVYQRVGHNEQATTASEMRPR